MNKELLFDEVIENILSMVTLARVEKGELINKKSEIWIKVDENKELYLNYIPYEFNGIEIHGNARINLAKEFINKYSFDYLKKLHNDKIDKIIKYRELEENNRYKLENLINELNLNKFKDFTTYKDDIKVKLYNMHHEKYVIEILITENNKYTNIQIYNNDNHDGLIYKIDYEEVDYNNFIIELDKLYIECNEYKIKKDLEAKKRKEEAEKEILISNTIYNLYKKVDENIIILKIGKKSFTAFEKGLRYSVGTGKSGKYYNCNWTKFEDIILKKGMEKVSYTLLDKETRTYQDDNFYLSLEYKNII